MGEYGTLAVMKNPWVIIGIITIVLFGGAIFYSNVVASHNNDGVEITTHIKGNPDAQVSLLEYSDFQCPACATFQPILDQIFADEGDRIKLEYRNFPLPIHQYANQAAVAAEAAGQQGKFFEFHDLLFAKQDEWVEAATPSVFFIKYAEELDLDLSTFKRHMNSSLLRDKVKSDFESGRAISITGTPTFFLNGEKMEFDTYQDFIGQIMFAVDPTLVASSTSPVSSKVRFGL